MWNKTSKRKDDIQTLYTNKSALNYQVYEESVTT